ncbi:MAG: aminomethyl-transferring glycine dehydrogenase subunit GcvPA [Myxococcales bacterium]|nr:aminomethyl-transferring glycine dehydrogenase subunit GcvPA [Myxococcales bacterium]
MRYLPHTAEEITAMLERIGAPSIDALFEPIPAPNRLNRPLALEPTLDEPTLMAHLEALAARNTAAASLSFLGAGMYDHHIPPAMDQLLLRSEFYTAYTPYQPEVSQGTLQSIFEFQTIVCELLGMEVANASMYCGASATAEAALMARRITKRTGVILSAGLHPEYIATVRTYLQGLDEGVNAVRIVPTNDQGQTDLEALQGAIGEETAVVIVGYPNVLGAIEPLDRIREITQAAGALMATATSEPYALTLLQPPGAFGADIAVGEGQALAVPPQFGGPGVGLFACRQVHVRQMPGRLVGQTVDSAGERGYVLTLSTREQHIRRERATSNICTNHGLIALAMTIRTAMLGKQGFRSTGERCFANAEYLKAEIGKLKGFAIPHAAPTFNEFVVRVEDGSAKDVLARLAGQGILGGVELGMLLPDRPRDILVAVTERHTREDLDRLVSALANR